MLPYMFDLYYMGKNKWNFSSSSNKLSLNSKKTNYIIFSASNTNLTPCNNHLVINNERIHLVGEENKDEGVKFMGLYLDKHITWKTHINSVRSKMARSIYNNYDQ